MDFTELSLTFPIFFEKCLAAAADPCKQAYSPILARSSGEYLYQIDQQLLYILIITHLISNCILTFK